MKRALLNIILIFIFLFSLFYFLSFGQIAHALPPKDAETDACSASLFGTVSKKYCKDICPEGTEYGCLKVKDFPGKNPSDPSKDLECYTCARDQYCSDLGYLSWWDCPPCDANPKTECVKAGTTVPLTGTTVGGKTWSGEQCYDCVARPDRCDAKWPGTTWLNACRNTCKGADEKCVFVGVHDGNDCYRCEKNMQQCKDMGLLKETECAACNADPKTRCVPWAMTKNLEKCFKCIPKNQPPPPPPPPPPTQPPKSCASLGYAISAAVCRGQGMDWHLVDVPEIGEKCIECVKKKEDCSPNLTREGCSKYCEAIGGQCMAMTKTKEGPECYTCYWGEQEKQGCAYYEMPEGCEPNPCFENETCVMVDKPLRLRCAACQPNDTIPPQEHPCHKHQLFENCAFCYNAQMSCEKVELKDPPLECFRCIEPPALTPPPEGGETTTGPTGPTETSVATETTTPQVAIGNNYPGIEETPSLNGQCALSDNPYGGPAIKDNINWAGIFDYSLKMDLRYNEQTQPSRALAYSFGNYYQRLRGWLEEAKEEKVVLEKDIADLQAGLKKPEAQKNPVIRETMEQALGNAKDALEDVEDEIYDLLDEVGTPEEMRAFLSEHGFLKINLKSGIDGGMTQIDPPADQSDENFRIERAWGEVKTPMGRIDFGRMSSHWGMGLFEENYLSDQGLGETLGLSGPIITAGLVGKETVLGIYDSMGIPVGMVTRQEAMLVPQKTADLLTQAQQRSFYDFGRQMSGFDNPFLRGFADTLMHEPFSEQIKSGYRVPFSWSEYDPRSVYIPQLGMRRGDIYTYGNAFNQGLINRNHPDEFFSSYRCCSPTYYEEPIYNRHILAKKESAEVDPNDPLYWKSPGKKSSARPDGKIKKSFKAVLGSGLKMGDVILGGGASDSTILAENDIPDQWGIRRVGYLPKSDPDSAWNMIDGRQKNVLVAVIDSGLDLNHPDGPEFIWTNPKEISDNKIDDDENGYVDDIHGWNFLEENNDLKDLKGHGTIVTGIIAAKTNNNLGVAGINPGAEIMALKVTDKNGNTNSLNIYRAIRYAVDHGAKVINASLGDKGISRLEQLTINYARAKGVLVVVASGNDGGHISEYGPASASGVITVGSMDYEGTWSTVSNWGPNIALLAPGEQIYSLHSQEAEWDGPSTQKDRRFTKASGTSFAAPMVAATASLIWANNPSLTNLQVADVILSLAEDMKEKGWDHLSGNGVLDAKAALRGKPEDIFYVQIVRLRVNRDKNKKVLSVDVFGAVQGPIDSFVVETGRGKNPAKWLKVSGPYQNTARDNWLCRIPKKVLGGGEDVSVRIKATTKDGREKTAVAQIPFTTEKKRFDWEKEK